MKLLAKKVKIRLTGVLSEDKKVSFLGRSIGETARPMAFWYRCLKALQGYYEIASARYRVRSVRLLGAPRL